MWDGCEPGANRWIEGHFHDCVYDWNDMLGFVAGLASIGLWVTAQIPQFVDNYRNQSAEALSIWFLGQWFMGDTLNLLGCLLSGQQLATTVMLAMYFVLSDVVMLTQFLYYRAVQKRKEAYARRSKARKGHHHHHHHHHSQHASHQVSTSNSSHQLHQNPLNASGTASSFAPSITQPTAVGSHLGMGADGGLHTGQRHSSSITAAAVAGVNGDGVGAGAHGIGSAGPQAGSMVVAAVGVASVLSIAALGAGTAWNGGLRAPSPDPQWRMEGSSHHARAAQHGAAPMHQRQAGSSGGWSASGVAELEEWEQFLGTCFGACAALLYLGSRVSQIYKNHTRKSAEGLSIAMFCFTIAANLCTGSSILLRLTSLERFWAQAPWIVGALGTVLLDVIIFRQARLYATHHTADSGHQHQHHVAGVHQPLLDP